MEVGSTASFVAVPHIASHAQVMVYGFNSFSHRLSQSPSLPRFPIMRGGRLMTPLSRWGVLPRAPCRGAARCASVVATFVKHLYAEANAKESVRVFDGERAQRCA